MIGIRKNSGFTFLHILTVTVIIMILMGMMTVGMIRLKEHAETTTLIGRANKFGQALQMYYAEHRSYPSAFPAQLEVELASYFNNEESMFSTTADNSTGPDELNALYIQPSVADPDAYVLCFESKYAPDKAVVLFADGTAEVVQELEIMWNNAPIPPGTEVTGNRVSSASGSLVAPLDGTTITAVQSFLTKDGTPYDIIKVEKDNNIKLDALSANSSLLVISTEFGNTTIRDGGVTVQRLPSTSEYVEKVSAHFGEVVTDCRVVERGALPTYTPGDDASGEINVNPNNNDDFEFQLTKPDGTMITRDDLLASGRQLEYTGPVIRVCFKPKGNGNQNRLVINNEIYPLRNGTLYTLTATNMTVHLYNDSKNGNGKAMGRWWLDDIVATDAQLVEGDVPVAQQSDGFTLGSVVFESGSIDSKLIRTLSRGSIVRPGTWIKGR